ncbi:MAG: DUF5777 family beta-barrel protein [Bacteroidota bacterium]
MIRISFVGLLCILCMSADAFAQLQRKPAVLDEPVEVFLAQSLITTGTAQNLGRGNINSTIMHNFDLVSTGYQEFWGLDAGANVRLGIDVGLTDNLSVGIGRTSSEDNVDLRFKYTVLNQMASGKIPVQLAIKGDVGINTQEQPNFDFSTAERLNYFGGLLVARRFNERFSAQIAPMISHFNMVVVDDATRSDLVNTHLANGFGAEYRLNDRHSFSFEYIAVLGDRSDDTFNPMALSWQIDTGGHVFQIFVMNGNWFTEQHLIARTTDDFFAGDFRIGFNVNRVFGLKK